MVVRDSPPEAETLCEKARPMCATYMAATAFQPLSVCLHCPQWHMPAVVGYSLAYLEWPLADPAPIVSQKLGFRPDKNSFQPSLLVHTNNHWAQIIE